MQEVSSSPPSRHRVLVGIASAGSGKQLAALGSDLREVGWEPSPGKSRALPLENRRKTADDKDFQDESPSGPSLPKSVGAGTAARGPWGVPGTTHVLRNQGPGSLASSRSATMLPSCPVLSEPSLCSDELVTVGPSGSRRDTAHPAVLGASASRFSGFP
ncbi:hypothetical protein TREES_T100014053 [Tupaia chinensis]|uniref:Uncharacterized protein n=1 Tax=Tupaia chinensis TaxID=246437 RepID=L9KL77_TUPCH|nr:hypothetical protein TREES_T100014053 [Tupaia chinensis]